MKDADTILRELVVLKQWRDRCRQLHEMGHGTDYPPAAREREAWDAAFAWADQKDAPAASTLPERDTSKPAEAQGLFRKFDVRRTDGSDAPGGKHHGCEYFVLDVKHDPVAKAALTAYAQAVRATHPLLADDMVQRYELDAPAAAQPRFFMDHGLWHDRETGQHLYTQEQYDEARHDAAVLAQQEMEALQEKKRAAPAAPAPALSMKRHEWESLSPEAKKLLRDRTREHTLRSAQAAQDVRDAPLTEPTAALSMSMFASKADYEAARAAAPAPAPDGFVLVPVEPTEAMIAAGWIDKEDTNPEDIYAAMIAARPAAQEQTSKQGE